MLAINASIRREAVANLLGFPPEYGRKTFLSERLDVSVRWLLEVERRVARALQVRPAGRPPGSREPSAPAVPAGECCCGRRCPSPQQRQQKLKAVALRLSVSPCSLRDTSDVLALAFDESVSRQWIADLIHRTGRKARAVQEAMNLREGIVQAAADEIFAGRKPILTVVEPVSLALLDALRSDTRRGKDWEKIFGRYPKLQRVAADCGTGLGAAMKARGLEHQPDPFHGLHELYASVRRL